MKAIAYHMFGSVEVLQHENLPEPAIPGDGYLIEVRAASLNVIDIRSRKGEMAPFVNRKFPKIPGCDFAGVIAAAGPRATRFRPGDAVFGSASPFVGGAFAGRVAVREEAIATKPGSLSFEQAAALPITGLAALYSLRELGRTRKGSKVLIYGSSGGAGLAAIQLARYFGAHVTAVCGSRGVDISREMGADVTLDYSAGPIHFSSRFDVIIDFSGHFPFAKARASLEPQGRFIEASPTIVKFLGAMVANLFRGQKHLMLQTEPHAKDLEFLGGLADRGALKVEIAKTWPMASAREAYAEQEKGGVIGKLVVTAPPF